MSEETDKRGAVVNVRVIKSNEPPLGGIAKADHVTSIQPEEKSTAGDWIEPPFSFDGLDVLYSHSTILPQCINAYKGNIVGFGIGIDYTDDSDQEESPEMIEEYNRVQRILDLLSYDCETKDMFGKIVETREKYGIAFVEVIRNLAGEVAQIENIRRPGTVRQTIELDPYLEVPYYYKGEMQIRRKKFRKFKQTVGGRTVYFKEFGDPRIMDKRTGRYVEVLELDFQANEIIDFPIGDQPYGMVRWIGQMLGIDGAAKAERLNNNYFENGRHTPMMIMIQGGTLSEKSFDNLKTYMNEIKGERGQHAFMVLETELTDAKTQFDDVKPPTVTIKDLSPMLQKDELFQGYLDNVRKKVQSSFLLPDLYVGYTTDFNRATAQTAMEITEKQVFIPMRREMAWVINRKLLGDYQFKFVEIKFRGPDITNPDDQAKLLNVIERAGGMTPNEAHELAGTMYGRTSEDYEGDWGNTPLVYAKMLADKEASAAETLNLLSQVDEKITKAQRSDSDELVAVMKQVRALLAEKAKGG
ncbi:MAG: phage portal protein [Alphaproteobacteria bacterium]|nr:phage portal protein [Alphaproteobacteria bacterium]